MKIHKIDSTISFIVLLLSLTIGFLQISSPITTSSFAEQLSPPQQQLYKQIIDVCSQAAHNRTIRQDQLRQCDNGMLFLQGQCEKQLSSANICSDLRLNNYIITRGLLLASRPQSLSLAANQATTIRPANQTSPPSTFSTIRPANQTSPPSTFSTIRPANQTSPPSTFSTIRPANQTSPPQSAVPGLLPVEQPPRPTTQSQQGLMEGFKSNGTINSVIFTPNAKWIATGNLSMQASNGNLIYFTTKMIWYNENGIATHTHEIQNFRPTGVIQRGNSLFLQGLADVGTNHHIVWKNVHSTIDMKGGKTISISLDGKQTNNHFAGQPIYGVIASLIRCSDVPGANMEVLPFCTSPTS
jgi:hypothetical protein